MVSDTSRSSKADQAAAKIRAGILSGEIEVGRLYSATELGATLGISRTPVREALLSLERQGLIEIKKNRGAVVLPISIEDMIEVFQIRLMLEIPLVRKSVFLSSHEDFERVEATFEAFRVAAESNDPTRTLKCDRDFHDALLRRSENARALKVLREHRDFVLSTGIGTVPASRSCMECFEDHFEIFEAYRKKSVDGVGIALGKHIRGTAEILIEQETADAGRASKMIEALDWLIY
ncbi:GntR family transcriptional regulator [Corynebacterium riegelii]|uniref:GntR family transcriptional regulator n=1 Tax=Corynebacterium riegelii TaxID=156976 RepID=UPI00288B3FF7|nr:GntR family transcriptional regulator [Corynebacterium riegelii]